MAIEKLTNGQINNGWQYSVNALIDELNKAIKEGGSGDFKPASAQKDSEATTIAALREDYNNLLASLRDAGLIAKE